MESARSFIAIDISDEIRDKLDALQRKLKKVHSNVRWTSPKNMHLTLAFLGDVPIIVGQPWTSSLRLSRLIGIVKVLQTKDSKQI